MPNRHISQPPSELLLSRLRVLFENIDFIYRGKSAAIEEDLVSSYNAAMDIFLKSLDGSITGTVAKIMQGMPADPIHYNIFTHSILKDLEAIYSETASLDKLITASFNSIISEREQVIQISKRVSDKLGTYLLYADPSLGAGYFFGDSFNSPENIEVGSSLLDTAECFIGQDEGVILLPLDGTPSQPKIKSYVINKPSNGNAGNNYEIGVVGHDAIEAIGDSEPNTWFEYEKVAAYESSIPLILDITIALDQISVINHIHINPINFGTPSPVKIVTLETSKDGLEYVSIKDEIPIKDFVQYDEENTFLLSPATSKFSGQGFYSFLPRKAQFVHIVLEQYTPYSIQTENGTRLRYAIGIRDINILSRKFKTEGSLISKPFAVSGEAKKVALFASENPLEKSSLADITHSISENDGATWRPIQPQHRSDFDIPEVIDYNTIATGSITTSVPVDTLRHKIYMKRDTKAFEGNMTLKEEKVSQVDIVNVPVGGDFSMTTIEKPIKDTVRVILPFYGSYSCPRPRYGSSVQGVAAPMDLDMLEFAVDVSASSAEGSTDVLRFDLPFVGYENLQEHLRVFYNGSQIEYCAKDANALGQSGHPSYTSYTEVDSSSKVYFLDRGGKQLQFGYIDTNGNRCGFLPGGGSKIQVCLDGDNPRMELTDQGYVLSLSASSDGFKENVNIVTMDYISEDEASDYMTELPAGRDRATILMPVKITMPGKYASAIGLDRIGTPTRTIAKQKMAKKSASKFRRIDSIEKEMDITEKSVAIESNSGAIPPVFIPDESTWEIIEYTLSGSIISGGDQQFTSKKTFVDGRQELLTWDGSAWVLDENAYSFDSYSGNVYTGSVPLSDRKTMFKCKILTATTVPEDGWDYYRHSITGKINPQKIILDPKYVITHTKILSAEDYRTDSGLASTAELKSINLISGQPKTHSWFKNRIVKGTVKMDLSLFVSGSKPVEVPFIDGASELYSLVYVQDELVDFSSLGGNLYSYNLNQINLSQVLEGSPGFAGVRTESNPNPPVNYFQTYVASTPSSDGEWTYSITAGVCTVTVYVASFDASAQHAASYKFKTLDAGIDISGLYSIDYVNGTIHFATPISGIGNIEYEVSVYSAFYNIAEMVDDGDIKEIDEEGHKIKFSPAFGMRFLKQSTALKARPAFAKVAYEYYKKSTESLKDLEPYFSPICKDIAFRAVTASTLEEL